MWWPQKPGCLSVTLLLLRINPDLQYMRARIEFLNHSLLPSEIVLDHLVELLVQRFVEVDEFPLYPGWDLDVLVALPSAQAVGITVLIAGAIESEAGFMNSRYVVIAMFK